MFGIPFGIAALSGVWRISGDHWAALVADALAAVSALLTLALVVPWLIELLRHERVLAQDLRDPVVGPFVPVAAITPMLLSAALQERSDILARTLVAAFAFLTLVGGLFVVIAWLATSLPLSSYHPGFYLPTAGGALLTAQCVAAFDWLYLARTLFFIGVAAWLILGVVTSLRLTRTPLPPSLRPVVVIELAAPALASNTYLVVFNHYDQYAVALTATTAIMALVQVAIIPYFRGSSFGVAFWSAAFSISTTAALAVRWIDHEEPTRPALWVALALTLATGVVVLLTFATVSAVRAGRFFPVAPRSAPSD